MDAISLVYGFYGLLVFALTLALARTLQKNGAVFLRDVFSESPELATSVNTLLVTGFFMLSFGYAVFMMRFEQSPETGRQAIEAMSLKLCALLMTLACVHFANVYVFYRIRQRAHSSRLVQEELPRRQTWAAARRTAVALPDEEPA